MMLILLVISVTSAIAGHPQFVRDHLLLTPRKALGPEPWQLLSNAFFHLSVGSLLGSGIALWFFGTPVEQRMGRWRFVQIFVIATVFGSLAQAALGRVLGPDLLFAGASPAAAAMIAAFGVTYGDEPLMLFGMQPVKASTCAMIFLGITGIMHLASGDLVGLAGAVAGAGAGALVAQRDVGMQRFRTWYDAKKRERQKRRYKVLPGGKLLN